MDIKHIHLKTTTSTQDELKEAIKEFAGPVLISAEDQVHGRGTRQNTWYSFPHSLFMSFNLKPHHIRTLTSLEVGILLCDFFHDQKLSLKWPNDLFNINREKVGGVLIESTHENLLCGIGINGSHHPIQLFPQPFYPIGSLDLSQSRTQEIALQIAEYIYSNRIASSQEIIQRFQTHCFHLGMDVSLDQESCEVTGTFVGIGEYGEALIQTSEQIERCFSGSLIFR